MKNSNIANSYTYDKNIIRSIHSSQSGERLSKYIKIADGDLEKATLLYQWNISLSESLYTPLQILEVTYRNAISKSISNRFGEKWYSNKSFETIIDDFWKKELKKVIIKVAKKTKGKPFSTGDVISDLTFSFWREMLKSQYEKHIWNKELRSTFPNLLDVERRQNIYNNIDASLKIRNRIFHHEPILTDPNKMMETHEKIIKSISWICNDTSKWTSHHSMFLNVLSKKPF
jgi:hypothetical protein